MPRYSHSQIQTYLTCPLKYRYEKVDGLGKDTQEESLNLALGSATHAALEFLYQQVSDQKVPDKQSILDRFQTERTKEISSFQKFIPEEIQTFRDRGVSYIHRYYDSYQPFNQAITMSVEENIQFALADDIDFSGKIDRIDVAGDSIIINDYKTNKRLKPDGEDTNYEQLVLYGLGIKHKYGQKFSHIIGKLIYLHLQKEYSREITDEIIATIQDKYLAIAQDIEAAKARYDEGNGDPNAFPATPGQHCQYCPFQSICPKRKHQFMDDEVAPGAYASTTIRRLVDEYATLSKQANSIDKEKKLLKEILIEYAQTHDLQRLIGQDRKTSVIAKDILGIKAEHQTALQAKLEELGLRDELCRLDTNALLRQLKKNDGLEQAIHDDIDIKRISYLGPVSKAGKDSDEA